MARVPVVEGNMVQRAPKPGAGLQAADMGAGGREIGDAVQRFGGAVLNFAEDQDKIDATLDEAGAKSLDTEYSQWSRSTLFDGDDAYYKKEGFNAGNAKPSFEKSINDKRDELLAKATTPRMRYILSQGLQRRTGADLEGISRYSIDQLRVANVRASAGRLASAADDAVTYFGDTKRFPVEMAVGYAEIDNQAQQKGLDPGEVRRQKDEFTSGVWSRAIRDKIAKGDVEGASSLFDGNRDKLLPDQEASIDAALYEPMLERKADGLVDSLMGTKPPMGAPQTPDYGDTTAPGLVKRGNIDLTKRTPVANKDGSISTELSFSIGTDEGEVLLPQVVNGKVVTKDQAIRHYKATGENLGVFATPEAADAYAEKLHNVQGLRYVDGAAAPVVAGKPGGVVAGRAPRATEGVVPFTAEGLKPLFYTQESSGDYTAKNKDTGALGKYQVMPDTGRGLANKLGVPWQPALMTTDTPAARAYQDQIGLAAIQDAIDHSGGDPRTAFKYYYGGGDRSQWGKKTNRYADEMALRFVGGDPRTGGAGQAADGNTNEPGQYDLNSMLARVDGLNLPFDLKQRVRRQLMERVGTNENLRHRDQEAAADEAATILDNGTVAKKPVTRYSEIPQTTWDRMSPETRRQYRAVIDRNANPDPRETNYGTYTYLSDLYAKAPDQFVKIDPSSYRNNLKDSDYDAVMTWRRDAIKATGQGGRSESQVTFSRVNSITSDALSAVGITTVGIKEKDTTARAAVAKRQYLFNQAVLRDVEIWQRANPGKPIADSEISQITDRLLTRWRPQGSAADPKAPPTYYFERSAPAGIVSIPNADLARLRRQGRAALGREPTENELSQAYLRESRGGR